MEYGRYQIVKELGRGNMGVVYQAHDPQIDRMVALKVLRPDRVTSEDFVARFLKEARAIGRLSHPQIVTVYDVGEDKGTVYIAMEYLTGEPLDEVMKSGRLTVAQSVDIIRQVAMALDYAHQKGIVHRDIKPSNIILTRDLEAKLTDFGIARIEDSAAGYQTQVGEILGTPIYMSPEQVTGDRADGRSDLFSVGVLLYEMILGRRPFSGNTLASIFHSISHDEPEPPVAADPFITRSLSDVVMKSLEKAPEKRFQTGRELVAALETADLAAAGDPTVPAGREPIKAHRLKPGVYGLAAVIVLVGALAAGGYYYFGRRTAALPSASTGSEGAAVVNQNTQNAPVKLAILKVSTEPEGANIYVDSQFKGKTPLDVTLPLGKYELRLSLADHLAWQAQVELDTAGEMPLHVAMRPDQ
jgi:eukaryotic-like serine/threonine-protein kinase